MTKKDYIILAKVLKSNMPPNTGTRTPENYLFDSIVADLEIELSKDNPRFDVDKFGKACRV